MEHKTLLTDGEAARLLRMLPVRLNRLAKKGVIPCVILPDGEIRFDEQDLCSMPHRVAR